MPAPPLKLTREIRFGLHPEPVPTPSPNGFAANPTLAGLAPFLSLRATIAGSIDPETGMLLNIKLVDRILREYAIPQLRAFFYVPWLAQEERVEGCLIGRLLKKLDMITLKQLNDALILQRESRSEGQALETTKLGTVLIKMGIICPEQLDLALELQKYGSSCPIRSPRIPPIQNIFASLSDRFDSYALVSITLDLSPHLNISIHKEEHPMIRLSQRFEFSAAHRLHSDALSEKQNWDTFGRCNNPNGHGHNYELEVTLSGTPDPKTGELLPIPTLQQIVNQHVIDIFDHKHLNLDCPEFKPDSGLNPTVENIAKVIYHKLQPHIPAPAKLQHIKLWETPKTHAQYGPE